MRLYGPQSDTRFAKRRSKIELFEGTGSPNGSQVGSPGDLFVNTASPGDLFIKEVGSANSSGWVSLKSGSSESFFQSILNNQTTAVSLSGLQFDSSETKAARVDFDIERRTDTQSLFENGTLFISFDEENSSWNISLDSKFDDSGVTFIIDANGQVSYESSELLGANYNGEVRLANIILLPKLSGSNQFSILNNQTTPQNLSNLIFDSQAVKAAKIFFDLERRTDSESLLETGEIFISFKNEDSSWNISFDSKFDNSGVTFLINSSGQVQYESSELLGLNYSGELRITDIRRLLQ